METIIGLLIVILPIVFKLIGKKLESAAQATAPAESVEDWAETLRRHIEAQQVQMRQGMSEQEPEGTSAVAPVPKKPSSKAKKPDKLVAKPLLEEEPKKKREKIDVKKMIVHSEIMKPKYME